MNEWAFSMFTFTKLVLVLIWASVVILLRASDGSEQDHGRSRRYLSWLRMLFGAAALIVSAVLLFLERHNPRRSSSPPQHLRHTRRLVASVVRP
jgi:threonine/homoserine/homoserine lactone efflux protein